MSIREWLQENTAKHPVRGDLVAACVKDLKVTKDAVGAALRRMGKRPRCGIRRHSKVGLTREEFLVAYDADTKVRTAIKDALDNMVVDEVVPDAEFRREKCGQNASLWRHIADETEFHPYQFELGGKRFWALPETVKWALKTVPRAKEV